MLLRGPIPAHYLSDNVSHYALHVSVFDDASDGLHCLGYFADLSDDDDEDGDDAELPVVVVVQLHYC